MGGVSKQVVVVTLNNRYDKSSTPGKRLFDTLRSSPPPVMLV